MDGSLPGWAWFLIICWTFIALVSVMLLVRKGSQVIRGPKSPGRGVDLKVEVDYIMQFPYMDDSRER